MPRSGEVSTATAITTLAVAVLTLAVLTFAGFLGRIAWSFDLASSFRPQYAVLAGVTAVLAGVCRRSGWLPQPSSSSSSTCWSSPRSTWRRSPPRSPARR